MINIQNALRINSQGAYATQAEFEWLAQWAIDNPYSCVVMIGAGPGVMAIALLEQKTSLNISVVDKESVHYLEEHLKICGLLDDRTKTYLQDSAYYGEHWKGGGIDLLIIDGDHSYAGVRRDIGAWWPHVKAGGIVLFHDYPHNLEGVKTGVKQAFEEIPADSYESITEFDLSRIIRKVKPTPVFVIPSTPHNKNASSIMTVVTPVGPYAHNVRWLDECLQSVAAQTVLPREHILIDDGANLDESLENDLVRILRPAKHIGAGSVNLGIEASETDWVLVLNSDDYLFPKAVEKLSSEVGVYRPSYIRFCVNCSDGTLSPAGQCFHKNSWAAVGGYPNNFMLDYWLVDKIIRAGIPVHDSVYNDIYYHRYHPEQMSATGLM